MYRNDEVVAFRRDIHRHPEPAWTEIRTSAKIAEKLNELGCFRLWLGADAVEVSAIVPLIAPDAEGRAANCRRAVEQGASAVWVEKTGGYSGVVAELDTGRPGPICALRFDIDALPYAEDQNSGSNACREGYVSENGFVHACGHDGHTSIGIGTAMLLCEHREELCGKFRLLFQPAEESYCGAASMIAKGWLEDADVFLGMHLALSADHRPMVSHEMGCGCCDFMSFTELDVDFYGTAAHPCGASHLGKNALLAACQACLGLHNIAPHEEGMTRVNVGFIQSGSVTNTIPDHARIKLEYRSTTPEGTAYLRQRVEQILSGAAMMYGVTFAITDLGTSPTAKSSPELMRLAGEAAASLPWFEKIHPEANIEGSDDAAEMIAAVQAHGGQGIYMGMGADAHDSLHGTSFDFDERVLEPAARLMLEIIRRLPQAEA